MKRSLEGRLALVLAGVVVATVAATVASVRVLGDGAAAWAVAAIGALAVGLLLLRGVTAPVSRLLAALTDGTRALREGDFGLSIAATRGDELGELVQLYNELGEILRRERQAIYQRELLLDTVIQATPLALVLTDDAGRIIYANAAARQLFGSDRRLEGAALNAALAALPAPLCDAVAAGSDAVVSVPTDGDDELYQVSRQRFALNARPHDLHLLQRLTREMNRQEIATWKKVIRVISHELNNSLAPISSLAHSARLLSAQGDTARLDGALATIEERAARLRQFLDDYAQFAKLPLPRTERVAWAEFVERLRGSAVFEVAGPLPESPGWCDPGQLQQALLNLLRNAHESGSPAPAVALTIASDARGTTLSVADRGPGMSDEVLRNALLPFYTTKATGTGLGLALCREIAEGHGGRLTLANREGGGLEVALWLPAPSPRPSPPRGGEGAE